VQCYGSGSLIAMEIVSLMWRHGKVRISQRLDAHDFEIAFEKQCSGNHLLCNKRHVNPGSSSCGHEQRNRTQTPKTTQRIRDQHQFLLALHCSSWFEFFCCSLRDCFASGSAITDS